MDTGQADKGTDRQGDRGGDRVTEEVWQSGAK